MRVRFLLLLMSISTTALADPAEPPATSPPALPPPVSAKPIVVEPAPGQAAAAAPSAHGVPITATCQLGDHVGVDPGEARVAADIVCHELARRGATNTQHEVRLGKLGGRTMVTLASRSGNAYDERRTFVTGLDEINVAGPRLASALSEGKPIEDTRNVDNVLAVESRPAKKQSGSMAFDGGLFGLTSVGQPSGASAGFDLGLAYRSGNFGLSSHGRAGGIGSSTEKLSTVSLDIGARYYFTTSDFAPFIGAGLGLSYINLDRHEPYSPQSGFSRGDIDGSGFATYGQLGIEMFRTHHVAFSLSGRLDVPVYTLRGEYVMPLSLNVGLVFH